MKTKTKQQLLAVLLTLVCIALVGGIIYVADQYLHVSLKTITDSSFLKLPLDQKLTALEVLAIVVLLSFAAIHHFLQLFQAFSASMRGQPSAHVSLMVHGYLITALILGSAVLVLQAAKG